MKSRTTIKRYPFNPIDKEETIREIEASAGKYKKNWPTDYIIVGDEEAYVGETQNFLNRIRNHLNSKDRENLDSLFLICDSSFNTSVIKDFESRLIMYMQSDGKFLLQNRNDGNDINNDYYQRAEYGEKFEELWNKLRKKGLVIHSLEEIANSEFFKYSPYKALSEEQENAFDSILNAIHSAILGPGKEKILVQGGAGTGKTVLATYIIKFIMDYYELDDLEEDQEDEFISLKMKNRLAMIKQIQDVKKPEKLKVGLIINMESLNSTMKKVFKTIKNLSSDMVIRPIDLKPDDNYDILIVDEAHRLWRYKNLPSGTTHTKYKEKNKEFGLDETEGTQLDWIHMSSKVTILFYDPFQSVSSSDIKASQFKEMTKGYRNLSLNEQLRCRAGEEYLEYLKEIFGNENPENRQSFDGYDFVMYEDADKMVNDIKDANNDENIGLSRVVAGYAWPWVTKKNKKKKTEQDYDIYIQGKKYVWNSTSKDWIGSDNSINEIGCVHTVQGYDLNYCGVIIGNDLGYDKNEGQIVSRKENFFDTRGKKSLTDEQVHEAIINAYLVLLTRGIRGTYVYVCDPDLRDYLRQFFDEVR